MDSSTGDVSEFPRPPFEFEDREGREVRITTHDGPMDPLVEMYLDFTAPSRAQGLPPRKEPQVRSWLDTLLGEGLNVVVWHEDSAVGHAVLMPFDGMAELAIFVHPDYQGAGIGSKLIRVLLGYGQAEDVGTVWLAVEHTNRVAMNLYESVGFEKTVEDAHEHEMELEL